MTLCSSEWSKDGYLLAYPVCFAWTRVGYPWIVCGKRLGP